MKVYRNTWHWMIRSSLALAVAGIIAAPAGVFAQEKGAEKLMKLGRIQTMDDVMVVEAGDTIVMSCPKCKDTWVTVVQPTFKGATAKNTKVVKQHQCPGCGSERVTKGHGKAKTTEIVHVCTECGSKEATCCVMKKGSASTRGMDQK